MTFSSDNLIGGERVPGAGAPWRAVEAATGSAMEPAFATATAEQADRACALAADAFDAYRETPLAARADFLDAIARHILDLGDELVTRCMAETGLPRPRIEGERGRTVGQLKMFAEVVRRGAFLGLRVDPAQPERKPLPRPDLRLRKIAVGPVLVFGASNFPLAFSVAGGDTASALAAGCPVVVKAHPPIPAPPPSSARRSARRSPSAACRRASSRSCSSRGSRSASASPPIPASPPSVSPAPAGAAPR